MLGGTNSLHTNALDETLALPSEQAAEIALRTQQVIMEETGVVNVADPLGGSWYVEALTDKIEAEANAIFDKILEMGGSSLRHDQVDAAGRVRAQRRGPRHAGAPPRHRGRLVHVRDRRGRLRLPDRAGEGREEGRRRQRAQGLGDQRARDHCASPTRSRPSRCASSTERKAGRDEAEIARAIEEMLTAAREDRNMIPCDAGRLPGGGHPRRDLRRAARGVGRVPRARSLLSDQVESRRGPGD